MFFYENNKGIFEDRVIDNYVDLIQHSCTFIKDSLDSELYFTPIYNSFRGRVARPLDWEPCWSCSTDVESLYPEGRIGPVYTAIYNITTNTICFSINFLEHMHFVTACSSNM